MPFLALQGTLPVITEERVLEAASAMCTAV